MFDLLWLCLELGHATHFVKVWHIMCLKSSTGEKEDTLLDQIIVNCGLKLDNGLSWTLRKKVQNDWYKIIITAYYTKLKM